MIAIATVVLGALLAASPPAPPPLTNEEVVRMVASGRPEAEILEAIRTRPCAFDLSEEMVEELKVAGVPASVLAAMAARTPKPEPPAPPEERLRPGLVRIAVTLPSRTLKVPAWADEALKLRLQLPKEIANREVHDLAVFLVCEAATHVPDQWRSRTPLGRDMTTEKRHEMLAFVPGETAAGQPPRLKLPAEIEAQVDDTEPHDLALGIAARIGDRWVTLAAGRLAGFTVPKDGTALAGEIRAAGGFDFKITLARARERGQSRIDTSLETPASSIVTP